MAVPFHVPEAASSPPTAPSPTTTSTGSVPQTPQPHNGGATAQHSPLLSPVNSEYLVQAFCEALYRYSRVQGGWWRVFICWTVKKKPEREMKENIEKSLDIKLTWKTKQNKILWYLKTWKRKERKKTLICPLCEVFELQFHSSSPRRTNQTLVDQEYENKRKFYLTCGPKISPRPRQRTSG